MPRAGRAAAPAGNGEEAFRPPFIAYIGLPFGFRPQPHESRVFVLAPRFACRYIWTLSESTTGGQTMAIHPLNDHGFMEVHFSQICSCPPPELYEVQIVVMGL